ncbi:MAG TPA: cellulosome anchoring protein cohesin region [Pyrodictiaceae archaeon]|nr:cellulosome anchoring protein cohesin region [Pyrodictiaceae archaeon]
MKKVFYTLMLFMALLSIETVLASENISLNVEMPKEVLLGENFTIEVYVNLSRNISGFECSIDVPVYGSEYIRFVNATGNEEIKEKAGEFYRIELKNDSVFITFAILFDEPLNSDFYLITVKGITLKEGNVPIRFEGIASDEEGRAIRLPTVYYNLTIVGSDRDTEKGGGENNIFLWIIEIISNLLRMLFGG